MLQFPKTRPQDLDSRKVCEHSDRGSPDPQQVPVMEWRWKIRRRFLVFEAAAGLETRGPGFGQHALKMRPLGLPRSKGTKAVKQHGSYTEEEFEVLGIGDLRAEGFSFELLKGCAWFMVCSC